MTAKYTKQLVLLEQHRTRRAVGPETSVKYALQAKDDAQEAASMAEREAWYARLVIKMRDAAKLLAAATGGRTG